MSTWAKDTLEKLARKQLTERDFQNLQAEEHWRIMREAPTVWDELKGRLRAEAAEFNANLPGTFNCQEPASAVDTRAFSISTVHGHLAITYQVAGQPKIDAKFFEAKREFMYRPAHEAQYEFAVSQGQVCLLQQGGDQYIAVGELARKLLDRVFPTEP